MLSKNKKANSVIEEICSHPLEFSFGSPLNNTLNEAVSFFREDAPDICRGFAEKDGVMFPGGFDLDRPLEMSISLWAEVFEMWGVETSVGTPNILRKAYDIIALSIELDLISGTIAPLNKPKGAGLVSILIADVLDMIDILFSCDARITHDHGYLEIAADFKAKGSEIPLLEWLYFIYLTGDLRSLVLAARPSGEKYTDLSSIIDELGVDH